MRFGITAAPSAAAIAVLLLGASPASAAAFGALAYDEGSGKYGLSANLETQSKADEAALKNCGGEKCKIVFRTAARQCGAVAQAEEGKAWGGGREAQRAAAELAAVKNCQKRTKGQCKVRQVECNK